MRLFLTSALLLFTLYIFSQGSATEKKNIYYNAFLPALKYEHANIHNITLGITNMHNYYDDITKLPFFFHGPYIDCGIGLKNGNTFLTNEIGYQFFFLVIGGRLNLINYTNFSTNQTCLRPEIGVTMVSFITLTYGYNYNLSSKDYLNAKGNVFSINIAYPIFKKSTQ